jgi:hypothetical protein
MHTFCHFHDGPAKATEEFAIDADSTKLVD